MEKNILRRCTIFVADNNEENVALLYDSYNTFEGAAKNIVYTCERNGSKTLSFTLPVPESHNGEEQNYLWDYIIPEYHICFILDDKLDRYIITKESISHKSNSKNVQVSVNHISSLLKFRGLDKVYSDDELNNIGTAGALITSILEGTEWTYDVAGSATFYEKDGTTEKRRSLVASAKTGCFSLLSKTADLFDGKILYDGDTMTVRILPMNPFSVKTGQELPEFEYADNVIELNYKTNLKHVNRNVDSSNIATVLYILGSYGDKTSGYCSIQELEFSRFSYTYTGSEGPFCYFTISNYLSGTTHNVYFPTSGINAGDELEYYALDYASDYYIWNKTQDKAILTCDVCAATLITMTEERLVRNFSFMMDFDYYRENNLLTDEQVEAIAEYQVNAWDVLRQIKELSAVESETRTKISETIDFGYYARLAIENVSNENDYLYLTLDNTNYDEGIIYHSQEESLKKNRWFEWRVATNLNNYGLAVNSEASSIYICDANGSYVKTFIKRIDKTNDTKTGLLLWLPYASRITESNLHYFIFGADSTMGFMGSCESMVETTKNLRQEELSYKGIKHPCYIISTVDSAKPVPINLEWGWQVVYSNNTYTTWNVYFFGGIWGDIGWLHCNYSDSNPTAATEGDYYYWYNYTTGKHWRKTSAGWVLLYDNTSKDVSKIRDGRIASQFAFVWHMVNRLKQLYVGWYSEYYYTLTSDLAPGTYFMYREDFKDFVVFTTHETISSSSKLIYDTIKDLVYPDTATANTSTVNIVKDYLANKYPDNEMDPTDIHSGKITETSKQETDNEYVSTGSFTVRSNTPYTITTSKALEVFWYSSSDVLLSHEVVSASGDVVSEEGAAQCRITMKGTAAELRAVVFTRADNENCKYIVYGTSPNDAEYTALTPITHSDTKIGLLDGIKNLCTYLDKLHLTDTPARKEKQDESKELTTELVSALGNLYRESWLQNDSYVDGDEEKLFDDGLKDLEELSKPTISYDVGWADLYNTDADDKYKWEDITPETAAYLVDDELNVRQWAFIDRIVKCIDEPAKSSLTLNTALTKLSQQSFNDVMSNIVKVSEETKAAESIYKRAESLNSIGQLSAEKLEGELYAATVSITGGSSNWTTDSNGNMIFTSADGTSAMMLSGNGLLSANSKDEWGEWIWQTAITGNGINASVINSGELNASLINAGTITADKLASNTGEKLEISSNAEVLLFATVSGSRPAGAVDVIRDGGSLISINATEGITIASGADVDIQSGATVSITGADVSINGGDIDMSANTNLNMSGAFINMEANSKLTVDSSAVEVKTGTLDLDSASSATIHGGETGAEVVLDNNGVKVQGVNINLLTNSSTAGKIVLGSDANYITSQGILSLHNEDLILSGVDGSLTTKGALNVAAGGNINLTTDTSSINMTAGNINLTGGTLTANGGAVDIKATSTLDIDSPNFKIVSSTGAAEIAGTIYAAQGRLGATKSGSAWTGGWVIDNNRLYSGSDTTYVELNSNPSNNYAILVGGENEPTQENAANFAVRRNGTTIINKLQRYTDDTHTALETIDLRKSLWQLNYGVKAFEKTDKADGSIDLTIKRTGMPDLTVNFTSAGGIKNYRFDKVSDIPTGGITFNVSGINSYGNVIPNTTHGPYNLTSTARYITVGDNQYIRSSGSITFTSPTTTSITGTYDNPFSLSTTVDTAATGAGLVITPIANLNYQMITGKTPVNANLTMSESISDDTLTVISEVATDTAASSTMKDYTTGGNILKYLSKLQITRKIISDETEKLSITTEHDVTAAATYTAGTNTITISPIAKISGGTTGDLEYKGSNITGTVSLETEVASGVRNHSAKFTIGTYTIYGSLVASYDPHTSKSVTPISGSGYSSTGNNKYLCSGYLTVPSTTYPAAVDPYSSSEVTPIGTSYTLTTNNIIGAARYTHKCSQVYVCGTKSYTVFNQTDPESGTTYHCVNASEGTVLYQQSSTTYYGSTSQCYTVNSTSSGASATYYLKGGSVKYTSTSAPDTLYAAGTAAQYIQYDGTLYTKTATEYARINASYAGEVIGTGVNTTKGWYANVGGDKTVYDAGTAAQYIQYDGTLYEPHDI